MGSRYIKVNRKEDWTKKEKSWKGETPFEIPHRGRTESNQFEWFVKEIKGKYQSNISGEASTDEIKWRINNQKLNTCKPSEWYWREPIEINKKNLNEWIIKFQA